MRQLRFVLLSALSIVLLFSLSAVAIGAEDDLGRLEPVKLKASCDDFRGQNRIEKSVKLAVHGRLQVRLCSNPSTGYSWSDSARISDHTVIWQTGHSRIPGGSGTLGAPGEERWSFQGLNPGTSTISLQYGRAWEDDGDQWSFTVRVEVVDDRQEDGKDSYGEKGKELVRGLFTDISRKDISALEKKTSDKFQGLGESGVLDKAGQMGLLKNARLEQYSLSEFKTTHGEGTLAVTYAVKGEGTIGEEELEDEPEYWLSVFVKTEDSWKWFANSRGS